MDQAQIDYVKNELARGVHPDTLRQTLAEAGYAPQLIDLLFVTVKSSIPQADASTPPLAVTPVQTSQPTWVIIVLGVFGVIGFCVVLVGSRLSTELNSARDQSVEASAKQSIINVRSMAEVHYSQDFSYAGMCENSSITSLLNTAIGIADCVSSATEYRVSVELGDGSHYCVDATGFSGDVLENPIGLRCEFIISTIDSDLMPTAGESADSVAGSQLHYGAILERLRFDAELYYNDADFAYTGLCTSGVNKALSYEEIDCEAYGHMYRISAPLSEEVYYCIDGTGFAGEQLSQPGYYTCDDTDESDFPESPDQSYTPAVPEAAVQVEESPAIFLSAEYALFTENAKLAKQFYSENNESYEGLCPHIYQEMSDEGIPGLECVSEKYSYRISAQVTDGSYVCVHDVADAVEETLVLQTRPTGEFCQ